MPLKIELELSDEDLAYFARVMDAVWKKNSKKSEAELIAAARGLLKQVKKAKAVAASAYTSLAVVGA